MDVAGFVHRFFTVFIYEHMASGFVVPLLSPSVSANGTGPHLPHKLKPLTHFPAPGKASLAHPVVALGFSEPIHAVVFRVVAEPSTSLVAVLMMFSVCHELLEMSRN